MDWHVVCDVCPECRPNPGGIGNEFGASFCRIFENGAKKNQRNLYITTMAGAETIVKH